MFNILHVSWRRRWRENPCGSSWSSHPQMLFGKQGWQWKISPSVYGLCQVGSCPLSCWNTRGYTISLLCRFHICVPVFLMFVGKAMHKSHVFPGWIRMFAAYCKSFFCLVSPFFIWLMKSRICTIIFPILACEISVWAHCCKAAFFFGGTLHLWLLSLIIIFSYSLYFF